MEQPPKRIRRLLREYAAQAHEEELQRALLPLAADFAAGAPENSAAGS
jgi:hypothetical protein